MKMTKDLRDSVLNHFKGVTKVKQGIGFVYKKNDQYSCLFCNIAQALDVQYEDGILEKTFSWSIANFEEKEEKDYINFTPKKKALVNHLLVKLNEFINKQHPEKYSDVNPIRACEISARLDKLYNNESRRLGGFDKFIEQFLPKEGEVL